MGAKARSDQLRRKAVRAGLLTFLGAALVAAFAVTSKNGLPSYLPGVGRTTVSAEFETLGALRVGDDVRIANVRSGFVDSIKLVDGHPVASMQLEHSRKVYQDAKAEIGARSALGQKYIELSPGHSTAGVMPAGTTIARNRTESAVELDEVLDVFDESTREATGSTLRNVGGGLKGLGPDLNDGVRALPSILPDLATISKALAQDDGADLAQMLKAANLLTSGLQNQGDQIAATTQQLDTTLAALAVDGGKPLDTTIQQAPETLNNTRAALKALNGPLVSTESAVRKLSPGARALGAATPDLRGLLREVVTPLSKVPDLADDTTPAVERLTPTVAEAEPLVGQLGTAFSRAQVPLSVLAPYSKELTVWVNNVASVLSQGDGAGRWLRFYVTVDPEGLLSTVPVGDPTASREAYPAPGAAAKHRENSPLGDGFR